MELKIANAQVIINYAAFLEENKYFEESFKIYERGIELFHFPIAFEIWNIYLSKFVKRYVSARIVARRCADHARLERSLREREISLSRLWRTARKSSASLCS
jgi:pre-mRNA-splicing factor SYF1